MESDRQAQEGAATGEMHKRRITLDDGRYMIFYTFDDMDSHASQRQGDAATQVEPQVEPVAEEERRV